MIPKAWFGEDVTIYLLTVGQDGSPWWKEKGTLRDASRHGVLMESHWPPRTQWFIPWTAIAKVVSGYILPPVDTQAPRREDGKEP